MFGHTHKRQSLGQICTASIGLIEFCSISPIGLIEFCFFVFRMFGHTNKYQFLGQICAVRRSDWKLTDERVHVQGEHGQRVEPTLEDGGKGDVEEHG